MRDFLCKPDSNVREKKKKKLSLSSEIFLVDIKKVYTHTNNSKNKTQMATHCDNMVKKLTQCQKNYFKVLPCGTVG